MQALRSSRDKGRFRTGRKCFVLVLKTVAVLAGILRFSSESFRGQAQKMSATQREWRLLAAAGVVSIFLLYFLYLDSLQLQSQAPRDYRVGT